MGVKNVVNIKETDNLVSDLAQTISTWLIYNSHVGGRIGIQENMIDYPVKAYLVCHQKKWKIATFEENHPYLSYRRIDFYLQYKNVNHYFEFKQAKKETKGESEFQRVYNDLIRLAICKKKNPKDKCFFLMFGDIESYKSFFVEGKKDNIEYADYFVFSIDNKKLEKRIFPKYIKIDDYSSTQSHNELYEKFIKEYEKSIKYENDTIENLVPDELIIQLTWTNYRDIDDGTSAPVVVGVWEILLESSNVIAERPDYAQEKLMQFIDASTGCTI